MQPGGLTAWVRATRAEATGAARATSVLLHAPGGPGNVGTATAATVVALAPLAAVAVLAAVALGLRAVVRRAAVRTGAPVPDAPGEAPPAATAPPASDGAAPADFGTAPTADGTAPTAEGTAWTRPWYQSRTAILVAATVPAFLLVTLVQFAKGGYLLAYLPGAVIALLLVPARLLGASRTASRSAAVAWTVVASLLVAAVAALGVQRFLADPGVLPPSWLHTASGPWFDQPRYQAPFPVTRAAIRTADAVDADLARLGPRVRADRDVVVFDTPDGGALFYRNAGWALPDHRVALIAPGQLLYNQLHRSLYYASGRTIAVGPGGIAYLVASPALPDLYRLTGSGAAGQVRQIRPIAGWLVFAVRPGSTVLGVTVTEQAGPRPLGRGL